MSMSKLLITLGLILLMTTPIVVARADSYAGSGTAVISDAGAMSDRVTFSMSGVAMLESGMAFEGWLVNSDSDDKVSTGVMTVLPDGSISHTWTSPDGGNLLEMYDTALITVESVPDDDPAPSDMEAFSDSVDGSIDHIRGLIVGEDSTLAMLQSQVDAAMAKIDEAHAADSLDALIVATEEAVSIIDADDGISALAMAASEGAAAAAEESGRSDVDSNASAVMVSSANVAAWAAAAKEDAAAVMAADNLDTAKTLLNIVNGKLMAAADGIEASGMGGASDAYMSAQLMATFNLPPPMDAAAPEVGDNYVPTAMHLMLFAALMLLATGGALLYKERRLGVRA